MDTELEAAIDEAGRDRVFARAYHHGWTGSLTPPKWVWWGIVLELRNEQTRQEAA